MQVQWNKDARGGSEIGVVILTGSGCVIRVLNIHPALPKVWPETIVGGGMN